MGVFYGAYQFFRAKIKVFGRAASLPKEKPQHIRAAAFLLSLASGYPLHHLRASRSVVPLLSLSLTPDVETLHATSLQLFAKYLIFNSSFLIARGARKARGIVAEPATKARRAEVADGADSPTRARRRRAKRLAQKIIIY